MPGDSARILQHKESCRQVQVPVGQRNTDGQLQDLVRQRNTDGGTWALQSLLVIHLQAARALRERCARRCFALPDVALVDPLLEKLMEL